MNQAIDVVTWNGDLSGLRWRKSSRSNGSGATACVEAAACPHHIAVRDSKLGDTPGFPMLTLSATDWTALLASVG